MALHFWKIDFGFIWCIFDCGALLSDSQKFQMHNNSGEPRIPFFFFLAFYYYGNIISGLPVATVHKSRYHDHFFFVYFFFKSLDFSSYIYNSLDTQFLFKWYLNLQKLEKLDNNLVYVWHCLLQFILNPNHP